uniref:Uncharacterized protein n=1 Tax=Arion vulgaris TaxID=1028688 RepID=A0A0B6Z8I2_9EUPU
MLMWVAVVVFYRAHVASSGVLSCLCGWCCSIMLMWVVVVFYHSHVAGGGVLSCSCG